MPTYDEFDSGDDRDPGDDWLEIIGDSNAGAYQKAEARVGPPLAYVAEKLRHALEQVHEVHGRLGDDARARAAAQAAFHYALVAHLALHNMLTLAGDHSLVVRLLAMPADELERWLDAVAAEGSVTG